MKLHQLQALVASADSGSIRGGAASGAVAGGGDPRCANWSRSRRCRC